MTNVLLRESLEKSQPNCLPSKVIFDTVGDINAKPSAETEGFSGSDSGGSEMGYMDVPIIAEAPNLYKQNGAPMSKIPYFFETPIPKYFRERGWFKDEKTWKYVTWAFSKCQTQPHTEIIEGKEITLAPYEFISGRLSSPKECFLTENTFRNQQKMLLNAGLLKKTTNSKTNHYTCFVWVTEIFSLKNNQPNNQPRTNHAPTVNHKSEEKKTKNYRKDHPSIPSSEKKASDGLNDDLFSKEENKDKIHVFTGNYPNGNPCVIFLGKEELNECVKIRGSHERMLDVIHQVVSWPGRQYEIKDWPNTIKTWKLKNVIADRTMHHEGFGKEIESMYGDCDGWRARVYHDKNKDQRGVLFEGTGAAWTPVFVSFTDSNFQEKVLETIKTKRMKKKGEP
jgi:hypothetical protein